MLAGRGWRGRGAGSALAAAAIGWAGSPGLHKLCLEVFAHNTAAIALYRRHPAWSGQAAQGAPDADLFNQKLDGTAWRSKPSWYIVANNNDRTVQSDLERSCAERMGAATTRPTAATCPCSPTRTW